MEKNSLTKGNKIAIAAVVVTLIVATIGVSFAAFYMRTPQEGTNVINTSCFVTEYTESSSMVNLAYAVPVSNDEGLASTPLSFTIKNKCDISEKYYIILNTKSSDGNAANLINPKYINISLNNASPTFLNQYPEASTVGYTNSNYNKSYVLASGVLTKDQTVSYQIRNWINENTTYDDVSRKSWAGKITIYTRVNTSEQSSNMPGVTESVVDKIRLSSRPSTSTMFSAVEPTNTISNATDDNFSKGEQTYTVDTTHQNYYVTYADNYTFNTPTTTASGTDFPTYTLTSAEVAKYSDIYGSLEGKYVVNYEGHNNLTAAKSEAIDRIYKVVSATATSITYIPSSYRVEFTNNDGAGVYTAEDDYGTSYYYRGNVTNNYVKFGKWTEEVYRGYNSNQSAYKEYYTKEKCQTDETYNYDCNKSPVAGKDMYWRIVRLNGDGSLRIMYDGTEAHRNGTKNLNRVTLPSQQFNDAKDNSSYVGYMYGNPEGTTYEEVHANTNPSAIKIALETWYEKNLKDTTYENKIGDISFCNDRSLYSGTGIGTTETYYGASGRLRTNKIPNIVCLQKAKDLFTNNITKGGNGKLTYPVGLLTADEAALVGGVFNSSNRGYFINKGYYFWLGSPYAYNSGTYEFSVGSYGGLSRNIVNYTYGAVPVINLSAEYANQLVGSGTMQDPYTAN